MVNQEKDIKDLWDQMRKLVKDQGITIITAKQLRPRKRRSPPPELLAGPQIIIVDYIGRIGK